MSRSAADRLGGQASIVGIGATAFTKDSGRSELQLAVEAIALALADAGLRVADVDGLVTFSMDTNPEIAVAQAMGMGDLSFFSRVHYGGGAACATVQQAAMAVANGVADVVVCYRALNGSSGLRYGSGAVAGALLYDDDGDHIGTADLEPGPGLTLGHSGEGVGPGSNRAVRAHDARQLGRALRAAVPAHLRRDHRVLRRGGRRQPQARGHQSGRLLLPPADHHG